MASAMTIGAASITMAPTFSILTACFASRVRACSG